MSYTLIVRPAMKDDAIDAITAARVEDSDGRPDAPETVAQIEAVKRAVVELLPVVGAPGAVVQIEVSGHAVTIPQPVTRTVMVPAVDAAGEPLLDGEGNEAMVPRTETVQEPAVETDEVVYVVVRALKA